MSIDLDFDTDNSETDTVDALATIGNAHEDVHIDTPLVSISFHKYQVNDNIVDGTNGLLIRNVFNALADQHCQAIARHIHDIQVTVQGREVIAAGTAVMPSKMFDENGKLLKEYSKSRTDAQQMRAQMLYASLVAHRESLIAIIEGHDDVLPDHPLQYAFVSNARATPSYAAGAVFDVKTAIRYRLDTNPNRLALLETARRVAQGRSGSRIGDGVSEEELLAI